MSSFLRSLRRRYLSPALPLEESELLTHSYRDSVDSTLGNSDINVVIEPANKCGLEGKDEIDSPFLPSSTRWNGRTRYEEIPSNRCRSKCCQRRAKRSRLLRCVLYPVLAIFMMLGIIQFVSILSGIVISFFPDEFDRVADYWLNRGGPREDVSHWPTDISRDIVPVGCHSHNDYWRRVPLYSALQAGCVGVEADVWLMDEELYVGHTTSSLTPNRTLSNMYINPLLEILDQQNPITRFNQDAENVMNGVFDTDPSQTLVLLIDFKTDGADTWPYVVEQLSPLREGGYLSYFNGTGVVTRPITVVGTGNAPFDLVTSNSTYRDIFFDAPLDRIPQDIDNNDPNDDDTTETETTEITKRSPKNLGQGLSGTPETIDSDTFNSTNSYYASVSFEKSIGIPWRFRLSDHQIDILRAQIRAAHRRGLKVRYWAVPSWPRSLRNHIWSVLVQEGADILNVDDLVSATKKEWYTKFVDWWF